MLGNTMLQEWLIMSQFKMRTLPKQREVFKFDLAVPDSIWYVSLFNIHFLCAISPWNTSGGHTHDNILHFKNKSNSIFISAFRLGGGGKSDVGGTDLLRLT